MLNEAAVRRLADDPRIAALWAEVEQRQPIDLVPSDDGYWATNGVGGARTRIHYVRELQPDVDPAAALTHELLHVQLQGEGYRRMRWGWSSLAQPRGQLWWRGLVGDLDNLLQHLRMTPRFVARGFSLDQFSANKPGHLRAHIWKLIASDGTRLDLAEVLNIVLSRASATGVLQPSDVAAIDQRLREMGYGATAARMVLALDSWARSTSYNAEATVRDLLNAIDPQNQTWISYRVPADPPDDGFFVNKRFRVPMPPAKEYTPTA